MHKMKHSKAVAAR